MTKPWDAVTVGEIYVDHVFSGLAHWPEPGEELFTRHYIRELGGGAAITACGLGRLGHRVGTFGVVGTEESDWMARRLAEFGVGPEQLHLVAGESGVTVCISVGTERSFYSHIGTNARLTEYLASHVVLAELETATHVHFAVPLDRAVARTLLPALKAAGATTSLDVGWQPGWYAAEGSLDTCREVDYFLPNEREARLLTGLDDPRAMMRRLAEMGLGHTIVKLGARGAIGRDSGGGIVEVSPPAVEVVDTTGAGDAFDAGLIDGILRGEPRRTMMERAAICGSLSTRNAGALAGLATREELERAR